MTIDRTGFNFGMNPKCFYLNMLWFHRSIPEAYVSKFSVKPIQDKRMMVQSPKCFVRAFKITISATNSILNSMFLFQETFWLHNFRRFRKSRSFRCDDSFESFQKSLLATMINSKESWKYAIKLPCCRTSRHQLIKQPSEADYKFTNTHYSYLLGHH